MSSPESNHIDQELPPGLRGDVARLVETRVFRYAIIFLIILNAVTLGLETSTSIMNKIGGILHGLDAFALGVFCLELSLKIYAYRWRFFKNGWNIFDFIVVAIALVPSSGPLSVLRAFRVLRVLRLMSVIPEMRKVVNALIGAIPGMASIMAVMLLIFYVSAVLVTNFFGQHPDPFLQAKFGNIAASMYTLFQIMTLEGWDGIAEPVMAHFPLAWLFFVPFIIITSFAVLNLFIGIIVDTMQNARNEASHIQRRKSDALNIKIAEDISKMKRDLAGIKKALKK